MSQQQYAILGLYPSANFNEVKSAYRRKQQKHLADKNLTPESRRMFRQVRKAYKHLARMQKKAVENRTWMDVAKAKARRLMLEQQERVEEKIAEQERQMESMVPAVEQFEEAQEHRATSETENEDRIEDEPQSGLDILISVLQRQSHWFQENEEQFEAMKENCYNGHNQIKIEL